MTNKVDRTKKVNMNYPDKDLLGDLQIALESQYRRKISKARAAELSGHMAKAVVDFLHEMSGEDGIKDSKLLDVQVFNHMVDEQFVFDLDKDEDKLNSKY